MREGMLHIHDAEGLKKTGSMETRLEAMEQQGFKCQGMVERGLNANHMMITEFTNKHMIYANDIRKHLSRLYDRIDQLQAQIYDLQNQNCGFAMVDTSNDRKVLKTSSLACPKLVDIHGHYKIWGSKKDMDSHVDLAEAIINPYYGGMKVECENNKVV
ncbi:Serine/threonine-protein kinase [Hordeum vulgare]|nr:Serine/threonine-protein kinase [Hordeum vulgare]